MTRRGQDARAPQMTDAQDSGDLQNTQMHNLVAAAAKLRSGGRRRVALTLAPGAGARLKQTLLALRECSAAGRTPRP
jgi:hypothetical protein